MSEPIASPPTGDVPPDDEGEMLQFDQAEFATPPADRPTCMVCNEPIEEEYYEIGQKVLCPRCRHGVEASFRSGSGIARFLKATVFGLIAAIVGAILYYGFVRITDWNLALVSILVGAMVGSAVRVGTGNRGGRLYQLLAVFLTYTSIAAMLSPFALEGLRDHPPQGRVAQPGAEKVDQQQAKAQGPDAVPTGATAIVAAFLILTVLVYALPVLFSIGAPISGLIFAFALWEAWKINKPVQLVFNGPFRLSAAGAENVDPEGVADEL